MTSRGKLKAVLIGIAGTPDDFLLSLHVLRAYLAQSDIIRGNLDITLKQYPFIPPEEAEAGVRTIVSNLEAAVPDIVGFSCYLWNMDVIQRVMREIRSRNGAVKIVLGGPEISRDWIVAGKSDSLPADFLIFGEGEKPLNALLEHLAGSEGTRLDDIKGLAFRRGLSFKAHGELDTIEDLAAVPSPFFSGGDMEEVLSRPNIRVNMESQRGCNFRCAYCFYHKGFPRTRYRDARIVLDEMEMTGTKGIRMCRIVDANFLSDKNFAMTILTGLIERNIHLSIFIEILPQFVDGEIAHALGAYIRKDPGNMIMAGMGIQSLNQEALAVIRRKIPVRFFERAFELLQKENVIIKSDIILGLPRETKASYFETLEFICEKMRCGTNFLSLALLRILPGSDLEEIAKQENLKVDVRDGVHFVYETPTMPREDMLECLRLNTVAFRCLSSVHLEPERKVRSLYFKLKDRLGWSHIALLQYLAGEFAMFLKDKNANYVKPDFPDAEDYSCKNVRQDISDDWLIEQLGSLLRDRKQEKTDAPGCGPGQKSI